MSHFVRSRQTMSRISISLLCPQGQARSLRGNPSEIGVAGPIAGLTALGIAVLTVGHQAVKAALANPVEALRWE